MACALGPGLGPSRASAWARAQAQAKPSSWIHLGRGPRPGPSTPPHTRGGPYISPGVGGMGAALYPPRCASTAAGRVGGSLLNLP